MGGIVIEPLVDQQEPVDRPFELEAREHRIIWHALLPYEETRMGDGRFDHIQRLPAMVCLQFGQVAHDAYASHRVGEILLETTHPHAMRTCRVRLRHAGANGCER